MAANLTRSSSNITDITKFMNECRHMGIAVLGPDVNESDMTFTVNKKGNIRFGLGAIKGVGGNAVASIVEERNKKPFTDIYDFVERVNLQACNKRTFEALAQAGAFDNLQGVKREHFFAETNVGETFTDVLLRFGNKMQTDKQMTQNSLFDGNNAVAINRPEIPQIEEWNILEKLNREKDLIGMYLSAHPLDPFRLEIEYLTNMKLSEFENINHLEGKEFAVAGLVTIARDAISKTGKPWGALTLEDFSGSYEFRFFGKDHETFRNYIREGLPLFIKGSVQRNYRNELDPKIKTITYLSNVRDEMLKSVSLTLPLSAINDDLMVLLNEQIDKHKGKTLLKFKIIDKEGNQAITMFSRNTKISLDNEIVDFLREQAIEFRLN
jgi:DNA polymerase-3 subunit alpha